MNVQNPSNRLEIDADSWNLLHEQGLSLDSVPVSGQKVYLKRVSNMGQGGIATDITDGLHPLYHDWVARIAAFLPATYFALDLMGNPTAADPAREVKALEINARPEWVHHTFSEVRTHDMAALVMDQLMAGS